MAKKTTNQAVLIELQTILKQLGRNPELEDLFATEDAGTCYVGTKNGHGVQAIVGEGTTFAEALSDARAPLVRMAADRTRQTVRAPVFVEGEGI